MTEDKKAINLLSNLLKFDTQNFDDKQSHSTLELIQFVRKRLQKNGTECELQKYTTQLAINGKIVKTERANLIAKIKKEGKPFLLLQGHIDTVPYDINSWRYNPLGEVRRNAIYGRGAVDMKGPVASLILALEELTKIRDLEYSPMILLTSDEEAQSFAGIKKFINNNKEKISFAVSCEPTNFRIINGLYGAIYFIIKTYGGLNKNAIENMIPVLEDIESYKKRALEIFDPSLGRIIFNIGRINGGLKVNQAPNECKLEIAIRNTRPCVRYLKLLEKEVLNKIKTPYEFELIFKHDPMALESDNKLANHLRNILKKRGIPVKFNAEKHLTEATMLNRAGIPAIIFGPGESKLAHAVNEKIKVKDILKSKEIYIDLFKRQ